MKVIDLLNKIANGEEVPKYIQYYNMLKDKTDIMMVCKENIFYKLDNLEIQLNSRVEIAEEEKKTIDDLNLTLEEIEAFDEARQIFLKLNDEEDKQTFIKLLLGEGTYKRWIDYLKSKGK